MKLIIVQSVNDFCSFHKYLSKTTDILAFDQNVMIELDNRKIKYN